MQDYLALFNQSEAEAEQNVAKRRRFFDAGDVAMAAPRGVVEGAKDAYGLVDTILGDHLPDWKRNPLGESTSTVGSLVEGATNFAVGFFPAYGALGKAGKVGKMLDLTFDAETALKAAGKARKAWAVGFGRGVTAGVAADLAVWDGSEGRLSDMIQQAPELANPITAFLATDESDSKTTARLKTALEGALLGGLSDSVMFGLRRLRAFRKARSLGKTVEEAALEAESIGPRLPDGPELPDMPAGTMRVDMLPELPANVKRLGGRVPAIADEAAKNPVGAFERYSWDAPKLREGAPGKKWLYTARKEPGDIVVVDGRPAVVTDAWDTRDGRVLRTHFGARGGKDPRTGVRTSQTKEVLQKDVQLLGRAQRAVDEVATPSLSEGVAGEARQQYTSEVGNALDPFSMPGAPDVPFRVPDAAEPIGPKPDFERMRPTQVEAERFTDPFALEPGEVRAAVVVDQRSVEAVAARELDTAAGGAAVEVRREASLKLLGVDDAGVKRFMEIAAKRKQDNLGRPEGFTLINPRKLTPTERVSEGLLKAGMNFERSTGDDSIHEMLRAAEELHRDALENAPGKARESWDALTDKKLAYLAELYQTSPEKMLQNIAGHLAEDQRTMVGIRARMSAAADLTLGVGQQLDRNLALLEGGFDAVTALQLKEDLAIFGSIARGMTGVGSETARTMRSFAQATGPISPSMKRMLLDPKELRDRIDAAGGEAGLRKLIELLRPLRGMDPENAAKAAGKIAAGTYGGKIIELTQEYWINAILSSPKSMLVVNALGPAVNSVWRPTEGWIGAKLDQLVFRQQGADRVAAQYAGTINALAESVSESFALRDRMTWGGTSLLDGGAQGAMDAGARTNAWSAKSLGMKPGTWGATAADFIGRVINFPTGLMGRVDEIGKQMNARAFLKARFRAEGQAMGLVGEALEEHVVRELDQTIVNGEAYSKRIAVEKAVNAAKAEGITDQAAIERRAMSLLELPGAFDESRAGLAEKAVEYAREVGLTQRAGDESWSRTLNQMKNRHKWLGFIIPFVNTPINILQWTGQRADMIGAMNALGRASSPPHMQHLWDKIPGAKNRLVKELTSGDPRMRADALGRISTGVGVMTTIAIASAAGSVTGRGPSDPELRQQMLDAGWQPYSIRVGDSWVSYSRLDPLATLVGTVADMVAYSEAETDEGADTLTSAGAGLVVALANNFTNKSYLTGVGQFVQLLQDPTNKWERFSQRYAGSFVPGALSAFTATAGDDDVKNVRSAWDAIMSRSPFFSEKVPPKRNLLGEPIKRITAAGSRVTGGLTDAFLPISSRDLSDDTLKKELVATGHAFAGPKTNVMGVDLTQIPAGKTTAHDRWGELHGSVKVGGKTMRQALNELVKSQAYRALSTEGTLEIESPRVRAINSIVSRYRSAAWRQLLREVPELRQHESTFLLNKRALASGAPAASLPAPTLR